MWDVWGINFSLCRFENQQTNVADASLLGIGIDAADAGFSVGGCHCDLNIQVGDPCPEDHLHGSRFKGLRLGINSYKISNLRPFAVDCADFENNIVGISSHSVDNIAVTNNRLLKIGGNPAPILSGSPYHIGIAIYSGTGFRVEENHFKRDLSGTALTIGAFLYNTGTEHNQLYKNRFQDLYIANLAQALNRDPHHSLNGLQYLCNKQENNSQDISVRHDDPIASNYSDEGIRVFQGDPQQVPPLAAGNTFSHINGSNPQSDFSNLTSWPVNYYFVSPGGFDEPLYYTPSYVQPVYPATANTCPSYLSSGIGNGIHLAARTKDDLMVQYDTSETAYLNLLYSYNQLMDGGNTNTLLSQIEQSWSQDAWNLRSSLIDKSPYLSEDVLRETALQNVLPQAMLLEVCLANPDATRSDKFLDFLRDDISNPLPEYMIEMIIASWNQETERTMLEGSLAHFSHEMAFVSDLLLTDLYLDTIGIVHYSDIRYWLNRTQTIPAKYRLAENYFQEHQYDSASSILASIPDNFDMSLDDVKEYNRYCYYVNFRHSILAGERNLMQLNGEEVDTLSDFAENGNDLGGMLAQNLLCFGYNICYEYNPNLPEGNYMRMGNSNSYKQALREINKVEVLPNPASTFATFSYKFPLLKSKAAVSISDVTGKIIEQFLIVNRQGQIIWDTRKIANGIYLYQIKDENSVLANGKVVVEK